MFEFLIELEEAEERRYKTNPEPFALEVKNYETILNGPPVSSKDLVNYTMARAIKSIAMEKKTISESNPLTVRGESSRIEEAKSMWTAAILLGMVLPHKKFNYRAVLNCTAFDSNAEIGYFTTFGSYSYYETTFKHFLTYNLYSAANFQ